MHFYVPPYGSYTSIYPKYLCRHLVCIAYMSSGSVRAPPVYRVVSENLTTFYPVLYTFFLNFSSTRYSSPHTTIIPTAYVPAHGVHQYTHLLRNFSTSALKTANAIILTSIAPHSAARFIILPHPSARFAVAIRNGNLSNVSHN